MKSRIVYIECKRETILRGPARIGRVTFSQSGRSLYYTGRRFERLKRGGYKTNYCDAATGAEYWISGCKRDGGDRLYSGMIDIDDDVREEYWKDIRKLPDRVNETKIHCVGRYAC